MFESASKEQSPNRQLNEQVVCLRDINPQNLQKLLQPYGLVVEIVNTYEAIPGSFWGDEEAGLVANTLYVRSDTPIHSALHEACHYICMDPSRRASLDTNAGGDYNEENGVCYLQILLADYLPPLNKTRMMVDMDAWGYSFRLGSASVWFDKDADDARNWLIKQKIITHSGSPTWKLRGDEPVQDVGQQLTD